MVQQLYKRTRTISLKMNFPDSIEQELAGRIHYLQIETNELPIDSPERIRKQKYIDDLQQQLDYICEQEYQDWLNSQNNK